MTPAERATLRRIIDERRRQTSVTRQCEYPPCGREFTLSKYAPGRRFCCGAHRKADWHRRTGWWVQRDYARRRRAA